MANYKVLKLNAKTTDVVKITYTDVKETRIIVYGENGWDTNPTDDQTEITFATDEEVAQAFQELADSYK